MLVFVAWSDVGIELGAISLCFQSGESPEAYDPLPTLPMDDTCPTADLAFFIDVEGAIYLPNFNELR